MARADTLLQTVVPADLARWARSRATREGIQLAAWLRQLVARERSRLVVDAYWRDPADKRAPSELFTASTDPPFTLERVGLAPGDRVEFRWLTRDGRILRDTDLAHTYTNISSHLYGGRFVLRGDPRAWRVVHALADASDGNAVVFTLEPDVGPTSR